MVGTATLLSAGTAVSALAAGGGELTPLRAALAAAVLAVGVGAVSVVVTDRGTRTRLRCLLWGGLVPLLAGAGTAALVGPVAGPAAAAAGALPWLAGLLPALVGPALPQLRLGRSGRPRRR
ncbi:hypothetical protein GCM10009714_03660 [Microlunatus capsulatus]